MFFDTHAHYDDTAFDADRAQLLDSLPANGVELVIDPGCDVASSRRALALAEQFRYVFAAVGIHPEELAGCRPGDTEVIASLAKHDKCVAIGEIGLDYYWDDSRKQEQKALFLRQIELALEADLPVIVHDREAHADCLEIVLRYPELRGVFHCFSGSAETAEILLKHGWYLGFDGPVTYKNARRTVEVLERCPTDRILLETDSPYLSPVPMRGKRNDSRNLRYIAERVAQIKGLTAEEIAFITRDNGKRLFGIA